MDFFATAARGTEVALRDELRELRFRGVRADRGGVHFHGQDLREGGRACLSSRIAVRILTPLSVFEARDANGLYEGVRAIDWQPWITPKHTLAVSAVSRESGLSHTQFIAQKTKDGVVDQLRDAVGARPSVDLDDPDVRIFVHVVRDKVTVYLDVSGESLHRRGYRTRIMEAPLKETLAAAMLRMAGWDRTTPLTDPMCGSGTLPIEADLLARNVAPGIFRDRFGFERWPSCDEATNRAMLSMREELHARAVPKESGPEVSGSDTDELAITTAEKNAERAFSRATFGVGEIGSLRPLGPRGFIILNPPYGERLAGDEGLYRAMADTFRRLPGHTIAILAGTPMIERIMTEKVRAARAALRPVRSLPLWNGPIECRLLVYEV